MTSRKWTLLFVFACLGLVASSISTFVHYKVLTDPAYTSFCDVNAAMSCTQAYLSRYGSIAGVPVAIPGLLYFLVVIMLAAVGSRGRSRTSEAAPAYIFVLSTIALAAVLYLGWASYVQLHTFCVLCTTTYVAVIGIFIVSGTAGGVPVAALPMRAGGDLRAAAGSPAALAGVVLVAAIAVTAVALFPREGAVAAQAPTYPSLTDQQRAALDQWWAVQPRVELPIGNDGAKVLIVKFSDFMCPACRQTYEWYKPIIGKYVASGQARYIVKHYPLEAECNPSAPMNHYASCEAAAAVIMARPKGTADALEQWIFSNQPTLTPANVKQAAKDVGGVPDFDGQYTRVLDEVKADAALGAKLSVSSTPTFYINGRKLPGQSVTPPQYFEYLIELALKDAK